MISYDRNKGLILTACLASISILYYRYKRDRKERQELLTLGKEGTKIKPPFPSTVRKLLSDCRLAYLSTVDVEGCGSHLSLMRFTYVHDEDDGEVVIMSTNKRTKKFTMLQKQKGVALLVHDFEQDKGSNGSSSGLFSITLNGHCRIVTDEVKSKKYRAMHLKNNPEYPQFIVGEDIAILCIDVTSARICNIYDQVQKWDVNDSTRSSISKAKI